MIDWDGMIEKQEEALARILLALAAMAGLLDAARFRLPRDVYRAVLGPLRAAEAAALLLPLESKPDAVEAARLRLRLLLLCRVIDVLIRQLLTPPPGVDPEPAREIRPPPADQRCRAGRALEPPDTS